MQCVPFLLPSMYMYVTMVGGLLFLLLLLLIPFTALADGVPSAMTSEEGWAHAQRVIERIQEPLFPAAEFSIADFGAVGDGITDCTAAFRNAIDHAHQSGGGRVVVPQGGIFMSGPIVLKSNINLHIPASSTIRFLQEPQAYLPLVRTRWEGVELMNYSPLIYAFEEENIAITGTGTLDGNANATVWWPWKYGPQKPGREILFHMARDGLPVEQRLFGDGYYLRPNFVEPYRSKNVLIEGVRIINSPMWVIHPTFCTNVIVRGVIVDSHGPNNDGCDPDSCKDVLIENSSFDTGDDCVAVKSGRGDDGRRINVPSVNVIMRNCTMKDGHGGLVAGSEIAAGVSNLYAEDCHWDSPNLRYGLRIKSNPLFGGVANNIFVRNVRMKHVERAAIRINFKYEKVEDGPHMPQANNIFVENVSSERSQHALQLEALSDAWASNIIIRHSNFTNVEKRNVISFIDGLTIEDVQFKYVPYWTSTNAIVIMIFGGVCFVLYVADRYLQRQSFNKTPTSPLVSAENFVLSKGRNAFLRKTVKHEEVESLVEMS